MRRPPPLLAAIALGAAALLAPGRARALDHEWHLGASFGYSNLAGATTANGYGGGLHLAYGINDTFNFIADLDAVTHPYAQWTVATGGVGVAYVLDVLRWVPWFGAEAGPAAVFSTDPACGLASLEPCRRLRINLSIPLGLDYRVTRRFSVGAGGRIQMLLLGDTPWTMIGVFARAEVTWGG